MFINEHGTMPAPRKSSISSNEYMEIRRQQNKDAQRRWREKKKIERETEVSSSSSSSQQKCRQGKISSKGRLRKESTSSSASSNSPKQINHSFPQEVYQPKSSHTYTFHQFNLPHPAYAPALHHHHHHHHHPSRTEYIDLPPSFDKQRRLSLSPSHSARLNWSEMIELAYHHSNVQQGISSGINLPSCNFTRAFVENARMMGLDVGYACDPSSSSSSNFIARDWTHYQQERRRFDNQTRRNSMKDPMSDVSNSSLTTSPKDTLNEKGFIQLPPPFSLSEKRLPWDKIPKNMHPTEAQLRIDHHPFIDVAFPWPSMREKILTMLANDIIDQVELYEDCFLSGLPGNSNQELAFLAWGTDLSDPFAWEISERFAQKWWFLLDEEIIFRSNWWRKQRGLPALRQGERKTRML